MNLQPTILGSARRIALVATLLFTALITRVSAATISSSFTLPTSDFMNLPTTESNPTLGNFNFSSDPNFGFVNNLGLINISLTFFGLDTNVGGLDNNNITLTLGGFNTGIVLNGFTNGVNTLSFNNQTTLNAQNIIDVINNNGGVLSVGLLDGNAAGSGTNPFAMIGGTASLSFVGASITPVPFTPVQTFGFGLIALIVAWRIARRREWPQLVLARIAAR